MTRSSAELTGPRNTEGDDNMSKPRMYGMNSAYIPNSKAHMRHHKKVYQRGREKPTTIREDQKVEQRGMRDG